MLGGYTGTATMPARRHEMNTRMKSMLGGYTSITQRFSSILDVYPAFGLRTCICLSTPSQSYMFSYSVPRCENNLETAHHTLGTQ